MANHPETGEVEIEEISQEEFDKLEPIKTPTLEELQAAKVQKPVEVSVLPLKTGMILIQYSRMINQVEMTIENARTLALSMRQAANLIERSTKRGSHG